MLVRCAVPFFIPLDEFTPSCGAFLFKCNYIYSQLFVFHRTVKHLANKFSSDINWANGNAPEGVKDKKSQQTVEKLFCTRFCRCQVSIQKTV